MVTVWAVLFLLGDHSGRVCRTAWRITQAVGAVELLCNKPGRVFNFWFLPPFPVCCQLHSLQATPSVGYSSYNIPRQISRPCFQSLSHVQFGQMVQNSVISVVLQNCPQLINFISHSNSSIFRTSKYLQKKYTRSRQRSRLKWIQKD